MRNAFAQQILECAENDERVVVLSGDIGNRMFDDFKARFPDRFHNCGIAEANMIGVAAGMAMSGMRPVVYTIIPFVTARCLEQIRIDLCYHNLPVIIVGVGAGFAYAGLGATHHACDDIGILRPLPNMQIVCPADPLEVRCSLKAAFDSSGPVYLRLGKKGEPRVHETPPAFEIGKGIPLKSGHEVAIVATGTIVPTALKAAERLREKSEAIEAEVISLHTVKPLDETLLHRLFSEFRLVVSVEEHSLIGGLGSAIAEWYCDQTDNPEAKLLRIGTPDRFFHTAGSPDYARREFGIDVDSIVAQIEQAVLSLAPQGVP